MKYLLKEYELSNTVVFHYTFAKWDKISIYQAKWGLLVRISMMIIGFVLLSEWIIAINTIILWTAYPIPWRISTKWETTMLSTSNDECLANPIFWAASRI